MDFTPHTDTDRAGMLEALGLRSVDELFAVIPEELRAKTWELPPPLSELEVTDHLRRLAELNVDRLIGFLGAGFYDHFIPAAVDALIRRGEFYTVYTPYQAEISQGTLQAIYEYQTAVCRLTGLDAANASLYDGGTALFEAAMIAVRRTGRRRLLVCSSVNPIYRVMLRSYTANLKIDLVEEDLVEPVALDSFLQEETAGVILQNPDFFGRLHDFSFHLPAGPRDKGPWPSSVAIRWPWASARRRERWGPTSPWARASRWDCPFLSAGPTWASWPSAGN